MQRSKKYYANSVGTYDMSNFFGFGDNDIDLSVWEKSSVINETTAPSEFQPNMPYRLALYVRPSEYIRLQRSKPHCLVKNQKPLNSSTDKQLWNKKNESLNNPKVPVKRPTRTTNKDNNAQINVMLFDENVKPEHLSKSLKKTPEKLRQEKSVVIEVPSVRKSVLKEVNTKPVTKTKQNRTRRSYERKCKKTEEVDNIPEPPSEEIIKELEIKKLSRTKQRKTAKEEQEFEKWANSVNSDFNDVDKFELSIAYD